MTPVSGELIGFIGQVIGLTKVDEPGELLNGLGMILHP